MNAFFVPRTASKESHYTVRAASPRKVDFILNESQCEIHYCTCRKTLKLSVSIFASIFSFGDLGNPGDLPVRPLH